jgi:hypothetical protein
MRLSRNRNWGYNVVYDGDLIVDHSRDPECDAARALLARDITGKLTLLDGKTGRPRTVVGIEKAAKLRTVDPDRGCLHFQKWTPFDASHIRVHSPETGAPVVGIADNNTEAA